MYKIWGCIQTVHFFDYVKGLQKRVTKIFRISKNLVLLVHASLVRSSHFCRVISRQPLRVKTQMNPFWKLDNWGYNILKKQKLKILSWTPPLVSLKMKVKSFTKVGN